MKHPAANPYPCAEIRALHHGCQSSALCAKAAAATSTRAESASRCWLYLNCAITIAHALAAVFFNS